VAELKMERCSEMDTVLSIAIKILKILEYEKSV
jgi:hypothetical protein